MDMLGKCVMCKCFTTKKVENKTKTYEEWMCLDCARKVDEWFKKADVGEFFGGGE